MINSIKKNVPTNKKEINNGQNYRNKCGITGIFFKFFIRSSHDLLFIALCVYLLRNHVIT